MHVHAHMRPCVYVELGGAGKNQNNNLQPLSAQAGGDGLVGYALGRRDEPLTDFPARLEVGFGIEGAAED